MKRHGSVPLVALALLSATMTSLAGMAPLSVAAVDCRVELDRAVLPAGRENTAYLKVTLDAPRAPERGERPRVNLAVVIDKSGSMRGDKIKRAKEAAIEAVRRLNPDDLFSLVVYDTAVETVIPAQRAANIEQLEARIRGVHTSGNTALFAGVSQGGAEIRKHLDTDYVHRIILLSDGLANVGPSDPGDLRRLGAAFVKEGISVTTVGVGTDYNEDLMAGLAETSDGNTYFVESSRDLPRIFAAELGDVLSVVAKKVRITIECPDGVTPLRIIGRDGRIRGNTVELRLNQLYASQEKYALVEVRIPAGADGEERDIAVARVDYLDAFTGDAAQALGRSVARYSREEQTVRDSQNTLVQQAYAMNFGVMAQEEAIQLADDGQTGEAVQTLKNAVREVRELAFQNDDALLEQKAVVIEQQLTDLERNQGLTKFNRKSLRANSYQDKVQQKAR